MPVILRISSALSNPAPFTSYRTIITATAISPLLSPGFPVWEAFACAGIPYLPVDIVAAEDCTVMFLNGKTLLNTCDNSCTFHHTLIRNLLGIVAQKNMYLNQKIKYTSRKTTLKTDGLSYRSGKIEKGATILPSLSTGRSWRIISEGKGRHVRRAGQAHKAWHPSGHSAVISPY